MLTTTGFCDVRRSGSAASVTGDDLRITVYTAEPGTEDAERLALAIVLGTQALIE